MRIINRLLDLEDDHDGGYPPHAGIGKNLQALQGSGF